MPALPQIAAQLVESGRGILAADESIATMSARLTAAGVEPSKQARRDYRELLLTSPGLSESVSGVILCGETFDDSLASGQPFPEACRERGILPGIKVDTGVSLLPKGHGATITEGLDGLDKRLADYAVRGGAFAKWRAVVDVSNVSDFALEANAHALARYAALSQEHGIVPIVEPEVLCSGSHDLEACAEVTERTLSVVFDQLHRQLVDLNAIVLKPNMITPGLDGRPASAESIAAATMGVLGSYVPVGVPGIAFLSGGHSNETACDYLGEINNLAGSAPWHVTFSFGRALVSDALRAWSGDPRRAGAAQSVLLANCERASSATQRRPAPAGAMN